MLVLSLAAKALGAVAVQAQPQVSTRKKFFLQFSPSQAQISSFGANMGGQRENSFGGTAEKECRPGRFEQCTNEVKAVGLVSIKNQKTKTEGTNES